MEENAYKLHLWTDFNFSARVVCMLSVFVCQQNILNIYWTIRHFSWYCTETSPVFK